jgi:hypothetical protein
VPVTSIISSVREDMIFIDEVIGAGETGVTHFHVGPGKRRMKCLEEMLEREPSSAAAGNCSRSSRATPPRC